MPWEVQENHETLALLTGSFCGSPRGPPMTKVKNPHSLQKSVFSILDFDKKNTHMSKALNSNVKRAGSPAESPGRKHLHIQSWVSHNSLCNKNICGSLLSSGEAQRAPSNFQPPKLSKDSAADDSFCESKVFAKNIEAKIHWGECFQSPSPAILSNGY